jgi:hypothetical protein
MDVKALRILNLVVIVLVILNACQQEVEEIINPPEDQVITPNSVVANLVERTTLKDGSVDNVLDHASCISLVLPVQVMIDGNEFLVSNGDDIKMIEELLREMEEENEIDLIFPVTVVLADYQEIILHNEDELENLREQCHESGEDDDIECVDFRYPITISIYDKENQLAEVYTVNNDKELHVLFEYLDGDKICSIEFPITLILAGGEELEVLNNDDLEVILKNAENQCDEGDDHYEDPSGSDDHDGEDQPDPSVILVEGLWKIGEYHKGDSDETEKYQGFHLDFRPEGSVVASDGIEEVNGTWSIIMESGSGYLVLDFDNGAFLDELNEDWEIVEINVRKLDLRNESGGDGSTERLILEGI